jgi:glycosyltransferase involved in cell wall biosynthesis
MAWGKLRVSYKLLGTLRAFAMHDYIVSRRIKKMFGQIDIIHTWARGARETLKTAAMLGIPTVLERQNAHTRFAYQVVKKECERIGVSLPSNQSHAFNADVLRKEEEEYRLAYRLLCPSDFVVRTFVDQGFEKTKLMRHTYGFDEKRFYPDNRPNGLNRGLTMLFVGECSVRKGLHFALEAWFRSPAHKNGAFMIAGEFLPEYAKRLSPMLNHPSIRVLGHRNDIPELMRNSDILVLPSIEEGSALVTYEARGSGCVVLVSDSAGSPSKHMEDALIHPVGNIEVLEKHITMLDQDRGFLKKLRAASLRGISDITWNAAGIRLLQVYRDVIESKVRYEGN